MKTTTIDLLRHGEPEGGRMYRGGGTDHVLSEAGWQQMEQRVAQQQAKGEANWSTIISSPMLRCQEFAQHLADEKGLSLSIIENLREAGYGSWEGRTTNDIKRASEDEYWQFFADPVNNRPKNAEPLEFFTPRVNEVFSQLLRDYEGAHLLLISHLAVTRAIIGSILGMPLASQQLIDLPFAGMIRVINDRKGLRLLLF